MTCLSADHGMNFVVFDLQIKGRLLKTACSFFVVMKFAFLHCQVSNVPAKNEAAGGLQIIWTDCLVRKEKNRKKMRD